MPSQRFVVVVIGTRTDPRSDKLVKELRERTSSLRESGERLDIVSQYRINSLPVDARAVAVVLCHRGMRKSEAEIMAIAEVRKRGIAIIPVVPDLRKFTTVAPIEVKDFNGFELSHLVDIGELAGLLLESLGLQRSKRKIFISYARMDSSAVAQQLREAFAARWYSVFLDTISIRPGAVFQEELLQELADSDAVVLLNSPNVKSRPYVQQEIAFADQAGVSGVEVGWPGMSRMREGGFFMPLPLDKKSALIRGGVVKGLTPAGIRRVLRRVADMRTVMQLKRERGMLELVRCYAQTQGWTAVPYFGRHIELRQGAARIRLDLALGVPTSLDLERAFQSRSQRSRPAGRLLYDPLGITDRQADHLNFLGTHLDLQYLHPNDASQWAFIP
ncbi:toll/interleukin-1 receptor domain-containing protein [Bradyrhizobium sp. S3.9.1]|uniref:toll/interleukin-1 receptor domain-containing protein n=1 Tax=Bradyrhizobium sp. S3.9.1 TaxID=3156431 RepID=UPI00339745FB